MTMSRSGREFLERHNLEYMDAAPRPRTAPGEYLLKDGNVTGNLLQPPLPVQLVLLSHEGDPVPDRGGSKTWPNQKDSEAD